MIFNKLRRLTPGYHTHDECKVEHMGGWRHGRVQLSQGENCVQGLWSLYRAYLSKSQKPGKFIYTWKGRSV